MLIRVIWCWHNYWGGLGGGFPCLKFLDTSSLTNDSGLWNSIYQESELGPVIFRSEGIPSYAVVNSCLHSGYALILRVTDHEPPVLSTMLKLIHGKGVRNGFEFVTLLHQLNNFIFSHKAGNDSYPISILYLQLEGLPSPLLIHQ